MIDGPAELGGNGLLRRPIDGYRADRFTVQATAQRVAMLEQFVATCQKSSPYDSISYVVIKQNEAHVMIVGLKSLFINRDNLAQALLAAPSWPWPKCSNSATDAQLPMSCSF